MDKTEPLSLEHQRLFDSLQRADTKALIAVTEVIGDELLRRAKTSGDPRIIRLLHLSAVHLVELRGRLRMVTAHEAGLYPPAVLSPDSLHGAAIRATSECAPTKEAFRSSEADTNASTAGGSQSCIQCSKPVGTDRVYCGVQGPFCDVGCRENWLWESKAPASPSTPSPRSADAAGGAARAEGAAGEGSEADRAKSSAPPAADLSHHLSLLKGGGR